MADLRNTRHRHQGADPEDRRNRWWHSLHTRSARPSASQPVLHRRGGLQGRDPGWRAARHRRQRPVRCCPGQAERASEQPQGLADQVRGTLYWAASSTIAAIRMTPSHARKRGIKYRYYISSALLQGQAEQAGTVSRIPADEIEALVVKCCSRSPQRIDRHRERTPHPQSCRPGRGPIGPAGHRTCQCKRCRSQTEAKPQRDRSAVAQDTINPTPRSSRA